MSVARARQGSIPRKIAKIARTALKKIKGWANDSQSNFLHKRQLVDAELKSLKCSKTNSNWRPITMLYDSSITFALKEGFIHEAALACELAGNNLGRQDN